MENKTMGMITCVICKREFPLIAEEHYVSREPSKTGLAAIAAGSEPVLFDSFDCPHCGCQNTIQRRNRLVDLFGRDLPFDEDDEDAPVCPFPGGGECYCKDSCGPDCEFHPDYNPHPDREEKE